MLATPAPPIPADSADFGRWDHTRLARRILYGQWDRDLERRVQLQIGHVRREAWGTVDLSGNLYRSIWDSLAVMYDRWPTVTHPAGGGELVARGGLVDRAGLWALMGRVQRDVLGLREMVVRVDITTDGQPTYRPVYPDLVTATPDPERPDRPIALREARLRRRPLSDRLIWTWDLLDISDPAHPRYEILDAGDGSPMTEVYLGQDMSGEAYPYRLSNGTPIIPAVLYHAAKTGQLWDAYSTRELVEGTLEVGVKYTYLSHVLRSAAWSQRYAVDVDVVGAELADEDGNGRGRSQVVTDPSTLVLLRSSEDAQGQPQIGQWSTTVDPVAIIETISRYERRLISFAGINPADQIRMSGDPRSGYAVAVSRDAIREVQRRYEPQFREGDLELIRVTAALLNQATGSSHPEDGYQIVYEGVPLSPQERAALRDHLMALVDAGLMDRVSAYQELHPGTSREQAEEALENIARINARFRAA